LLDGVAHLGSGAARGGALQGQAAAEQTVDHPLAKAFGDLRPVVESARVFVVPVPAPHLLALASGAAFACIVLAQMANAICCRSETRLAFRPGPRRNTLLLKAIAIELLALLAFLGVPALTRVLGGAWPSALGWALALLAIPAVLAADTCYKLLRRSAEGGSILDSEPGNTSASRPLSSHRTL
jgi:Cation transporting ATPase, C-terminus